MNVLGIETSCDETSAAVVADGRRVLSNIVASQAELHSRWGGVVPEVASRKHVERVLPVAHEAMAAASLQWENLNGIAVTNRPGLVGALLVGVAAAKALAYALDKPLVAVHHLEGHVYANFLADPTLEFPFVCLIVSGGHTEILVVRGTGIYESVGRTLDDAAGECFDKCARVLGLEYPGGPAIDRLAAMGDRKAIAFPRAWLGDSLDFSFSGLKTAVKTFASKRQAGIPIEDIAASLQEAIVEVLVRKTILAAQRAGIPSVCVGGGVAANRGLRASMQTAGAAAEIRVGVPPPDLCTDNAAMIAAAATPRLSRGDFDTFDFDTVASAPL